MKNGLNLKKPWAILKSEFDKLAFIQSQHIKHPELLSSLLERKIKGQAGENEISEKSYDDYQILNKKAIIKIDGLLMRQDDICCRLMGGCSIDHLTGQFNHALQNEQVQSIIFAINSYGGDVDGVPEFASLIFNSRSIKPVYSHIAFMGASGAYWIAAAAENITIQEAASAGSIGIYCELEIEKKENDEKTVCVISSISPKKVPAIETPEGLNQIQTYIDNLGKIFVKNIAEYRGIDDDKVLSQFGQGDILIGENAVSAGMADQIGNFDFVLALANKQNKNPTTILSAKKGNNKIKGENKIMGKINATYVAIDDSQLDENQLQQSEEINMEFCMKNFPDMCKEIQQSGINQENQRQQEMDSIPVQNAEERELLLSAKKDFSTNAEKFALKLLTLRESKSKEQIEKKDADAKKIPPLENQSGDSAGLESLNNIRAGMKRPVKVGK